MSDKLSGYHQCQNCHYAFSDARQLEHHLSTYDEALEDIAIKAAKVLRHFPITHEILCPYINHKCRNSRFTRFQDFASHYNTHLECKKGCPGCGTRFTRSSQLMAHGCKATQEDSNKKRKLQELKDWAIERNLYEAKQAQEKFREELLKEGKGFLSSAQALRLMVRGLVPQAKRDVTTKIRDDIAKHMDIIVDQVIETIGDNLDELSLEERNGAQVVHQLTLDHYHGTKVPAIDPATRESPLADSGYYLLEDPVARLDGAEETRKILPRASEPADTDTSPSTTCAAPSTPAKATSAVRRAGRRVVRGKPRPGVKEPRPKINGPPRVRDKGRNRVTKSGRKGKTRESPHPELEEYVTHEYYTKQEPLSPSDTDGAASDGGGLDLSNMTRSGNDPYAFTMDNGRQISHHPPPFMGTDIHVYHATLPDPPTEVDTFPRPNNNTGVDHMDVSRGSSHSPRHILHENSLPTPRSISPTEASALESRSRIVNANYGRTVPVAPMPDRSGRLPPPPSPRSDPPVQDRGPSQNQDPSVNIPLVDGLPYPLRRGSAPAIGNSNHHLERSNALPHHGSGGTFMTPMPVNNYVSPWNEVTYQDWPPNVLLVDPLAQSIPPGVQQHPPMGLGNSAPEAFLGASTMAETVNTSPSHRLSFDSQASYLGSSSTHSSSYDGSSRLTYSSAGPGRSANQGDWKYAPSDEKAGYNFNFE